MFALFGGEESNNDEEAQRQRRVQEKQRGEQKPTEDGLPVIDKSSDVELASLRKKGSGTSMSFEEKKSSKGGEEDGSEGKLLSDDGALQLQNLGNAVGGAATEAIEGTGRLVGSTLEKMKGIFLHTYIGKVEINLDNFLSFDELQAMDANEIEVPIEKRFIRNRKNEGNVIGWEPEKLGTFEGTMKVSKPRKATSSDLPVMTPGSPTNRKRYGSNRRKALYKAVRQDDSSKEGTQRPSLLKKLKSFNQSNQSLASGGELSYQEGDDGVDLSIVILKFTNITLRDLIPVDMFQNSNDCFLSCRLEKKSRRGTKEWVRSKTIYRSNDPVFDEKKLKNFEFLISHEQHKWDEAKLVIKVYDENEGAQEITNGFNYVRNYFTHVMLTQVSDSVWLDMKSVSVTVLRVLAFVEIFAWLIICGYFAYISYMQGINQRYASLAEINDGICEFVPRQLDIDRMISIGNNGTRGIWSSNPGYTANTTAYSIELRNYEARYEDFQSNLASTQTKLKALSQIGTQRALHWNLILWATFTDTQIAGGGTYTFKLEGDVQTLFNKPIIIAGMANRASGSCELDATSARYDLGSQSLVIHIKNYFTTAGIENGKCSQAFDPVSFGIRNSSITSVVNNLEIRFDMQAMSVALAINMGQIDISELSRVALSGVNLTFPYEFCNTDKYFGYTSAGDAVCAGLEVVDWSAFYLPRYKGMEPVTCVALEKDDGTGGRKNFCLVRVGDAIVYPTIHHVDACSCADINSNDDVKAACNQQKLLTTVFYYPGETLGFFPLTLEAVAYLQNQIWDSPTGDDVLNGVVYPSAAALSGRASESDIINAITAMCPYFDCSIITFRLDAYYNNFAINDYAFQVSEPACTPSVYLEERFDELLRSIPFTFYEKYQKCRLRWEDNWILSVGISTGNASILTQLLMFALTLFVGQVLKHFYQYSTGFGSSDYAADLAKKRQKAKKDSEGFFQWVNRIWSGTRNTPKEEEEEEEIDWEDPKEHTKMKKDLKQQIKEVDSLKKAFNVAIPEERLKDVPSNVNVLEEQAEIIKEQSRLIQNLRTNNDELRKRLDELDLKVLAADQDAKKAIRAINTSTPAKGGRISDEDDKMILSNPGVVYSNAEKEKMREHLRKILIGAAPANS